MNLQPTACPRNLRMVSPVFTRRPYRSHGTVVFTECLLSCWLWACVCCKAVVLIANIDDWRARVRSSVIPGWQTQGQNELLTYKRLDLCGDVLVLWCRIYSHDWKNTCVKELRNFWLNQSLTLFGGFDQFRKRRFFSSDFFLIVSITRTIVITSGGETCKRPSLHC